MKDVITMFFCGTGSSEEDQHNSGTYWNGELINRIRSNMAGEQDSDYFHYDGPGTIGSDSQKFIDQAFGTGARGVARNTNDAPYRVRRMQENPDTAQLGSDLDTHRGKMAGAFRDIRARGQTHDNDMDAYFRALWAEDGLKASYAQTNPFPDVPLKINLVGWSRGGVTCLTVANALDRFFGKIGAPTRINIFAVDPVPGGPGSDPTDENKTRIPTRCDNFVGIYAMHERSTCFSAVIPHCADNRATTYWMPGRHATLVGNAHKDGNEGGASGRFALPGLITRDLAEKFLRSWGTRFRYGTTLDLNDYQTLDYYSDILEDMRRRKYELMGGHGYMGPFRQGDRRKYIHGQMKTADDLRNEKPGTADYKKTAGRSLKWAPDEFVNEHHREVYDRTGLGVRARDSEDALSDSSG